MASPHQVKAYFAYWLQLGKRLVNPNQPNGLSPAPILQGDHYSSAFETCWDYMLSPQGQASYLEGTTTTVAQLLSPEWDICACARCTMPVPIAQAGINGELTCPCHDLHHWPNFELPFPHEPVADRPQMQQICDRLQRHPQQAIAQPEAEVASMSQA